VFLIVFLNSLKQILQDQYSIDRNERGTNMAEVIGTINPNLTRLNILRKEAVIGQLENRNGRGGAWKDRRHEGRKYACRERIRREDF